jgi:hypothetical protein
VAQQINVPGVGVLSFPDGMSEPDMQAAIHKNFPQLGPAPPQPAQEQPSNTWGGALKGVADAGLALGEGGVVGGAASLARTVNRVLPAFGDQGAKDAVKAKIDSLQNSLTYTPQTAEGKYALEQLSGLTRPVADAASDLTGAVVGKDNVPAVADAAASIPFVSRLFGKTAVAAEAAGPVTRANQLQTLKAAGVRLDSSQELGSKAALTAKNFANDGPYGSPAKFQADQAGDYTAAALKEMGINSREATPAVMAAGKQVLKDNYNNVAKRTNIEVDAPLNDTIGAVRHAAQRSLTEENAQVIENQLQDIQALADKNGGVISGTAYKNLQEQLGNVAKDGGKAPFITQIRQALTGAVERQASPEDAALLAKTNQRYGAMKALEKAIGDDNQVSPSKLYNAMDTTKGAGQSVYGQGPNTRLMNLAQAGKAVLGNTTANSGTPQRLAGAAAIVQAGNALVAAATGHFEIAGALAATAAAAGLSQKAAQALAYTPAGKAFLQQAAQAKLASRARTAATYAPVGAQTVDNATAAQPTAGSTSQ